MLFAKPVLTLFAAVASAAAITINTPSTSSYWVQFTQNNITWSFNSGDPTPIDIQISNPSNLTGLENANFSIARFVDVSTKTFTVTNVTLVVASGYVVNFVNSSNPNQTFASSAPFQVMPPGTAPAPTSSSSSASSTATSPGGSSAPSGSSTGTGSASSSTSSSSSATRAFSDNSAILPLFACAGVALAGGLLAL